MMVHAIRWLVGVVASGVLVTTVVAEQSVNKESLPPTKYALQFQLTENFNFTTFSGSTISLRRFREGVPDCRLAISFRGGIQHGRLEEEVEPEGSFSTDRTRFTENSIDFRIIRQRINPLLERGLVTAYTAFGWTLPLAYEFQPQATYNTTTDPERRVFYRTTTTWLIGGGSQINLGVEIHHTHWLYSFVEYGIRGEISWNYNRQMTKNDNTDRKNIHTSNHFAFRVNPQALTLGLAVMF